MYRRKDFRVRRRSNGVKKGVVLNLIQGGGKGLEHTPETVATERESFGKRGKQILK